MLLRFLSTSRAHLFKQSSISFKFTDTQNRNFHILNSRATTPYVLKSFDSKNKFKNNTKLRETCFRSFSVTAVANSSNIPTELPPVPEVPVAPIVDAAAEVLEPAFASLDLGGWTPIGILQNGLEFLHIDCGLPWWGTIIASTIVLRILMTPVVLIAQRNAANMNNAMPAIQKIQLKMTEARQMGNAAETAQYSQELMGAMRKYNINPLKNMAVPLCQAPIFMSYFFGIRQMVNAPVESLKEGGLLWFTDLTVVDPYMLLPLATCATLLVTIEVGADMSRINSPNAYLIKYVLRAMPVIMFPFIINFPNALVLYWTTSNAVSLLQTFLFKIPAVRKTLNLPILIKHNPEQLPAKPKKFVEGVKDSWKNMKLSRELEGRKRLDEINFQKAGAGTLVRTYRYDPTKPRQAVKQGFQNKMKN